MTHRRQPAILSDSFSRRTLLRTAVAAGFVGLLAACGGAPSGGTIGGTGTTPTAANGTPKQGGVLKVGLTSDVGNLDPLLSSFLVDRQVFYNMYDSLVAIDVDLKIVAALAEKWEISPDGKTYTFTLRRDVKFHDGTDFNAEAVKFNIERYLNDKTSRRASEINSIQIVEAVDAATVKKRHSLPYRRISSIARG